MKKRTKAGGPARIEAKPPVSVETKPAVAEDVSESGKFQENGFALSPAEVVKSLYRRLLGREPEPAALDAYTRKVIEERKVDGVVIGLINSHEYRQKLIVRAPGLPIYLGNHRALIWTTHGLRMYVDTRDIVVAPHLLQLGSWEGWITDVFLKNIKKGATVIEVGSNMGYYTLLAASRVGPGGKVIGFEANPDLCELLFKSTEINGFRAYCEVVNKAVTDKTGAAVTFRTWSEHLGLGSIHNFNRNYVRQNYDSINEICVESVSLDSFLEERKIDHVDLIKIDAEGSEPLIFKGLEKTLAKTENITVIFEFSPMSRDMGFDVMGMLQSFILKGFVLFRIDPGVLFPVTSLPDMLSWPSCEILMRKKGAV